MSERFTTAGCDGERVVQATFHSQVSEVKRSWRRATGAVAFDLTYKRLRGLGKPRLV